MVEIAKRVTAINNTKGNHAITDANALEVTSIPFAPARFSPKLPVITMTSAVIEHTTIVSIKGSSNATIPSLAGFVVLTAEWAIGAEPMPASLAVSYTHLTLPTR